MSSFRSTAASPIVDFEPFPIPDVMEGEPDGRVHWLRQEGSDGRLLMAGIFTAQPAKYPYEFPGDETSHILDGRVTVELEDGTAVELAPGVVVSFERGTKSTWTIHEPFRKFFVVSG